MENSTYTILNIDPVKGHVTFKLSADDREQTVCDMPTTDPDALKAALNEYALRYTPPVEITEESAEMKALIGKPISVEVPVVPEPVVIAPEVVPVAEEVVPAVEEVVPVVKDEEIAIAQDTEVVVTRVADGADVVVTQKLADELLARPETEFVMSGEPVPTPEPVVEEVVVPAPVIEDTASVVEEPAVISEVTPTE